MHLLQKLRSNREKQQGFTLVEMLVVAPLVLIVLAGLIAAMVTMIGDSLAASERASVSYNIQDALDRIEQDSRVGVNFMSTFNYFTSPQGRDGGTGSFSYASNKDLIITEQATTASPYEATRDLVYYANQPNSCTPASGAIGNRVLVTRVVYFLKDGSLWRRTIVNPWNLSSTPDNDTVCSTPWQRDSCPTGSTVGSGATYTCNGIDEELLKNVSDFTPTFYTSTGSTTTDPAQATTVDISITTSQNISGETVSQTSTLRATRRNDVPSTPAPDAPTVSVYNPSVDTYNNSTLVSYQWKATNATSYSYQTSTDGTNWTAATPTTDTYTSISVAYAKQPAYIRVTAYNDQGSSGTTQTSTNSVVWTPCSMQNGWVDYGSYHPSVSYTYTSSKMVMLRGLAKDGTVTDGTVVCNLPANFRSDKRLLFQNLNNGSPSRIDVEPDGDVSVYGTASGWISLDQINYLPTSSGYTWSSDLATTNSWAQYSASNVSNLVVTTDNIGRAHIRGMIKNGTITSGTNAATLPSGYAPPTSDLYSGVTSTSTYDPFQLYYGGTSGSVQTRGVAGTNWSLQGMWWPASATTGWTTPTLNASWVRQSTSFSTAQYKKGSDGVVNLRGLIKSGTTTNDTVLFNLASGYRPSYRVVCSVPDSNPSPTGWARVDIEASGNVTITGNAANGFLSLAGCDFLAEQ